MLSQKTKSKLIAIGVTVVVSGLLTYWGIHGVGTYGMALFILTPLLLGIAPVVIYGRSFPITMVQSRVIGFQTLGLFTLCLIIFAVEGLICIFMVAPIAVPLTWAGTLIGHSIVKRSPNRGTALIIILTLAIPAVAFVEKGDKENLDLIQVTTSIEINADPGEVWRNVVEFQTLDDPTEFIFQTGIAYPINAEIKGHGIGAVRHCNFSTGSFVEPITVWNEPSLLSFDVVECPAPMKEISFYDIKAPHLHDYFVSKKGQFKLTKVSEGKTLLEGTTWYYHDIKPVFYWKMWSSYIIHKIHNRVLTHIKTESEK